MAHIGLLPQSVVKEGGYKIKGRKSEEMDQLIQDAKAVEEAGAFAFVIEGTVHDVAATITKAVSIPSIGIGAAPECDGQVLVTEDMLGLLDDTPPKFVKQYADTGAVVERAIQAYAADVRSRNFPGPENLYTRPRLAEIKKRKSV